MRCLLSSIILLAGSIYGQAVYGQEGTRIEVEMDTTTIQTHKELPMLLYIVPWKDTELSASGEERQIVIHNLFGDFYDPLFPLPDEVQADNNRHNQ